MKEKEWKEKYKRLVELDQEYRKKYISSKDQKSEEAKNLDMEILGLEVQLGFKE